MKLPFRQGIVRYQSDTNGAPSFLERSNGGASIDLMVIATPTTVSFAHRTTDYLHEESVTISEAWTGFVSNTDYWLYLDIDILSGTRTFGHTTVEPTFGPTAPPTPLIEHHWFDTNENITKVWNNITWVERVRVFVAKYDEGAVIQSMAPGSQVGISQTAYSGYILFDEHDIPVRKADRRGRGIFFTTETPFTTFNSKTVNVRFEGLMHSLRASEPIASYHCVSRNDTQDEMKLASFDDVDYPIIGIIEADAMISEWHGYTAGGYIESDSFSFNVPPKTSLYCAVDGSITTVVPQTGLIQRIGEVVNDKKMLVQISTPIELFYA
jgi:hypothetical protein